MGINMLVYLYLHSLLIEEEGVAGESISLSISLSSVNPTV